MESYKGNSNAKKSQESEKAVEKREVTKVATGKVRKQSEISKIAKSFLADDVDNVKDYIINDVLIPTIKNTLFDAVTNSLGMALGIDTKRFGGKKSSGSKIGYVNYNKMSEDRDRDRDRNRTRSGYEFNEILLDSREEAETVLDSLEDMIDRYDNASVGDLYDLVGIAPKHPDFKYGWTNIASAKVVYSRDGYYLKMPRPKPIDR